MLRNLRKLFNFQVSINNRTANGEGINMENQSINYDYYKGRSDVYEKWVISLLAPGEDDSENKRIEFDPLFSLNKNIPCWKKDLSGRLTYISPGYERVFLTGFDKKIDDYIGLTDVEFWGEEIGGVYRANDARAFLEYDMWIGIVSCGIAPGEFLDFNILKWKEYDSKGKFLGIAGMAIPARRVIDIVNEVSG